MSSGRCFRPGCAGKRLSSLGLRQWKASGLWILMIATRGIDGPVETAENGPRVVFSQRFAVASHSHPARRGATRQRGAWPQGHRHPAFRLAAHRANPPEATGLPRGTLQSIVTGAGVQPVWA